MTYNTPIPHQIMTPDTVETRLGTLNFVDGIPTAATTQLVYDNLDFMRGTEVFLNFVPACSIEAIRLSFVERGAGNATARAISFRNRDPRAPLYPNSQWQTGFIGDDYRWLDGDGMGGRNQDARTRFFYMATVNTPAMALKMVGVGSQYAIISADKDGGDLDGACTYRLNIPANAPAKDFWSVVVYDPQTRSELQTSQPFPSKNNQRDQLIANTDGSVNLYFGPQPPTGQEPNWIATVPGKGWFAIFRLYGPLEPWFDKTWQPGEIELVHSD